MVIEIFIYKQRRYSYNSSTMLRSIVKPVANYKKGMCVHLEDMPHMLPGFLCEKESTACLTQLCLCSVYKLHCRYALLYNDVTTFSKHFTMSVWKRPLWISNGQFGLPLSVFHCYTQGSAKAMWPHWVPCFKEFLHHPVHRPSIAISAGSEKEVRKKPYLCYWSCTTHPPPQGWKGEQWLAHW